MSDTAPRDELWMRRPAARRERARSRSPFRAFGASDYLQDFPNTYSKTARRNGIEKDEMGNDRYFSRREEHSPRLTCRALESLVS